MPTSATCAYFFACAWSGTRYALIGIFTHLILPLMLLSSTGDIFNMRPWSVNNILSFLQCSEWCHVASFALSPLGTAFLSPFHFHPFCIGWTSTTTICRLSGRGWGYFFRSIDRFEVKHLLNSCMSRANNYPRTHPLGAQLPADRTPFRLQPPPTAVAIGWHFLPSSRQLRHETRVSRLFHFVFF